MAMHTTWIFWTIRCTKAANPEQPNAERCSSKFTSLIYVRFAHEIQANVLFFFLWTHHPVDSQFVFIFSFVFCTQKLLPVNYQWPMKFKNGRSNVNALIMKTTFRWLKIILLSHPIMQDDRKSSACIVPFVMLSSRNVWRLHIENVHDAFYLLFAWSDVCAEHKNGMGKCGKWRISYCWCWCCCWCCCCYSKCTCS